MNNNNSSWHHMIHQIWCWVLSSEYEGVRGVRGISGVVGGVAQIKPE